MDIPQLLKMFNTIVNTNSQFGTNTTDRTHTTTHDESYTLTLSEENSHSRSDGGEVIDETNWSDYSENSSSDEYSRMEAEHYNEAKKNVEGSQVPVNNDKSSSSVKEYATGLLKEKDKKEKRSLNHINIENSSIKQFNNKLEKRAKTPSPKAAGKKEDVEASVTGSKGKEKSKFNIKDAASDFFNGCLGGAGFGTFGGLWGAALGCLGGGVVNAGLGIWQSYESHEANNIAEEQMKQEKTIADDQMRQERNLAKQQEDHEIIMALAGTHTTGTTTTKGHSSRRKS
jgi:hypothetical protein